MKTVFSPFYHEYVRYNPDSGHCITRNGRPVLSVIGTGTVSGKDYSIILIDGAYDDRCTMQLY